MQLEPLLDFPGIYVPLDNAQQSKLRKTFFPPLVLLQCLNEICPGGASQKASDAPPNPNQSLEEMFHTFVNKLAQICDSEPKGNTISAIAVIWRDGRICYLLASNRRNTVSLENARAGLTAVLDILKSNLEASTSESDDVMEGRLMREVLRWNSVRVQSYLRSLSKALQACMERCDSHPDGNEYGCPASTNQIIHLWELTSTNREKYERSTGEVVVRFTRLGHEQRRPEEREM
jgi:hypothetical protein